MVARALKIIGNIMDFVLTTVLAALGILWLFGFVHVYSLFNKIIITIG